MTTLIHHNGELITQEELDRRNESKLEAYREKRRAEGRARQKAYNDKVAAEAAQRKRTERLLQLRIKRAAINVEIAELEKSSGNVMDLSRDLL